MIGDNGKSLLHVRFRGKSRENNDLRWDSGVEV